MIWQPRDLWFESDLYLSWAVWSDPSGYWAHTRGCRVSLRLCSHYLLHKCCHLLWSKESCVCAFAFPSQWTHLAFPADHPTGRFWLSKITFWVDYTLFTASPNYSSALRWPPNCHRNGAVSECAWCKHGDRENRGQQISQLHGFLEKPFSKTDNQQNMTSEPNSMAKAQTIELKQS